MSHFPIETARLAIREWRTEDRPAFARMSGDAEMMRYINAGRPLGDDEVDEFFERQARFLAEHGFCMGAMTLKPHGEVIGIAGMQPLDIPGEIELGWWTWKDHWGQGYAAEAGAAFIEFGFRRLGLKRLVAVIDPGNAASARVAAKLGMHYERSMPARETVARRGESSIDYWTVEA